MKESLFNITSDIIEESRAVIVSLTMESVKREEVRDDGSIVLIDTGVNHLSVTWNEPASPDVMVPAYYSDDEDSDEWSGYEVDGGFQPQLITPPESCKHCHRPVRMNAGKDYWVHVTGSVGIGDAGGMVIGYQPYTHPAEGPPRG